VRSEKHLGFLSVLGLKNKTVTAAEMRWGEESVTHSDTMARALLQNLPWHSLNKKKTFKEFKFMKKS